MIVVTAEYMHQETGSGYKINYFVNQDGDLLINTNFNPGADNYPEIPRFGTRMQISSPFHSLEYFGRGPFENYQDRNYASSIGHYKSSVSDQYVPYIAPEENGNKTDTRWLVLKDKEGYGLMIAGSPLLSFSALHYSQDDLDREERDGYHTIDLEKKEEIFLNIDLEQMGVGGDNSWGARTHAEYTIKAETKEFWYVLKPVSPGDNLWEKAKL